MNYSSTDFFFFFPCGVLYVVPHGIRKRVVCTEKGRRRRESGRDSGDRQAVVSGEVR